MATKQIKVNVVNQTAGRTYGKTFKDITSQNVSDVNDAKEYAEHYAGVVDGTYAGGEYHVVDSFDAE